MAVTEIDYELACIETSTVQGTLTLNKDREYTLVHTGVQSDGTTSDTHTIMLYTDTGVTATDFTEELYKYPLMDDEAVVIGPMIETLYYKALSGTPVFAVIPSPPKFGRW